MLKPETNRAPRKLGTAQALKVSIASDWFGETEQAIEDTLRGLGFIGVAERSDLQAFVEGAIANAFEDARVKGVLAREEEEGRQLKLKLDEAHDTLAMHYGCGRSEVEQAMEAAKSAAGAE